MEKINPLPQTLLDQGYGHIGDIDMADGKLYAGLEQGDFSTGKQAVAWFDPQTLASHKEVAERAVEAKKQAKKMNGSSLFVERRRSSMP